MPEEKEFSFFDPSEETVSSSFDPIKDGTYECVFNTHNWKETNAGTGIYLEMEFVIMGGDFDGRLVWNRLNLVNKNEQAVQIAREQLAEFCRAVECTVVLTGEKELLQFMANCWGKKVMVKVQNKPRRNNPEQIDLVVRSVKRMPVEASTPKPKKQKESDTTDVKDPDKLPF